MAIRPLPLAPLQPVLGIAVRGLLRRHRDAFARMAEAGSPVFLIDPIDLPFAFVLRLDLERPSLTATRQGGRQEVNATIRGPFSSLIDLLEGRRDGDSLFFSRDLAIEGETEAVVALRNALDSAEIDLEAEVLSRLGPLAGPARALVQRTRAVLERATEDLETLRASTIAPAIQYGDALAAGLQELDERVTAMRAQSRQAQSRQAQAKAT